MLDRSRGGAVGRLSVDASPGGLRSTRSHQRFLRIPPFPGSKVQAFGRIPSPDAPAEELVDLCRRLRVGGTYWASQPPLPARYVLVRSARSVAIAARLIAGAEVVLWTPVPLTGRPQPDVIAIAGECDPWHMLSSAAAVVLDDDADLRLIAALLGVPVYRCEPTGDVVLDDPDPRALLAEATGTVPYEDPFSGEPMSAREAMELCGYWRRLIDSNRDVGGGLGFAFWKQDHVAPLLWNGTDPFRFMRNGTDGPTDASVAVWRTRAAPQALRQLEEAAVPLIEVEDGFLRSRGLGADCVPPLSITVDRLGPHFDPTQESELEGLIQHGKFDDEVLSRARALRRMIVDAGLGKYESAGAAIERPAGQRRHILVPGQVEDDRAVVAGGCGLVSNLELLRRVRDEAPDAYILYKPHPDVLAGHRRGAIPDRNCLQFADQIVGDLSIGSLIAMVDEVHVNTSLAGFEALLRGKQVTTYGVPFYAGWGLTHDRGPVPSRRSAKRTIDELVAATLLIYPRYFDPVTGLPCPAEVVVNRLSANNQPDPGLLVGMRRIQGKVMRRLRSLVQ